MQLQSPTSLVNASPDTLFVHSKRPQWGRGLCVERGATNWSIQFEDGRMRKLGIDFLHLCEALTLPLDEQSHAVKTLRTAAGLSAARKTAAQGGKVLISFDQQLLLFRDLYPEGFTGDQWTREMRGGEGRSIKRHRQPAIDMAQELLSTDTLKQLVKDGYWQEVVQRAHKILSKTSLVTKKQLLPLLEMSVQHQQSFAMALLAMVTDDGHYDRSHRCFIQALEGKAAVSWPLATALVALLLPDVHVCVTPASFRKQAEWMAPNLQLNNSPHAVTYLHLAAMVDAVREKLVLAGLKPRDMLDVTDFMTVTLRASNLKKLLELKPVVVPCVDETTPIHGPSDDQRLPEASPMEQVEQIAEAA